MQQAFRMYKSRAWTTSLIIDCMPPVYFINTLLKVLFDTFPHLNSQDISLILISCACVQEQNQLSL